MTTHPLERLKENILIFSGTFGSGKSEVAVNTAFYGMEKYEKVAIVDLDVVNPYFRCREARAALEAGGIEVIAPGGEYSSADLPIVLPQIRGRIMNFDGLLILDVGGDDIGARALGSLNDAISKKTYEYLMVLNERRPYTSDLQSTLATIARIEESAKIKATGLVSNTHLMNFTTADTIQQGYRLATEVSKKRELPLAFVTANEEHYNSIVDSSIDCPVMKLERRLPPPWIERPSQSRENSNDRKAVPTPGRPWGRGSGNQSSQIMCRLSFGIFRKVQVLYSCNTCLLL